MRICFSVPIRLAEILCQAAELQLDAYASEDFVLVERLGDVVDRAGFQPLDLGGGIGEGGEKDHRDLRHAGILLQSERHLVPVEAGHHHVQEHEIGSVLQGQPKSLFAVLGFEQDARLLAEDSTQEQQVGRVVVGDQDPAHGRVGERYRSGPAALCCARLFHGVSVHAP